MRKRRSAKARERNSKLKQGAATLAKPLRVTTYKSHATKLRHTVEIELITTHQPNLHIRLEPSTDNNFSQQGDPFFYEAENEVRVFIDGKQIASFLDFQGASDLVEITNSQTVRYLRERLEKILGQAAIELYEEWRDYSPKTPEVREALIAKIRNDAEAAARLRLPSIDRRPVTDDEFFSFVDKVGVAIAQLTNEGRTNPRGLKTGIAKILFPRSDNPLQEFKRQCDRKGINFVDLLFNLGRPDLAQQVYETEKRNRRNRRKE